MSDWLKSIIEDFSYAGLIFLMFLENVFPPIPSELIVPLAGFFSTTGELSLTGIIIAGTIGSVLGGLPLYYLGRRAGEDRVRRWCDRHGKWIGVSARDIDKSKEWFERHGTKAVLICRVIPGARSLISLPAGLAHMPVGQFVLYSTIGSAVWTTALAFAGRALGRNYEDVEKFVGPVSTAVVVGIVGTIVYRAIREHTRTHARG
jgi:membrane protein DedA with SNARE-associated domain